MGGEFLVSSRAAYLFRMYDYKDNPDAILAPGPGTNMFIRVEGLLLLALGAHSDSVKLPSTGCWQDEWLLLLCVMMRLVFSVTMVTSGIR